MNSRIETFGQRDLRNAVVGINRAISKKYGAGSVPMPEVAGGVSGGES